MPVWSGKFFFEKYRTKDRVEKMQRHHEYREGLQEIMRRHAPLIQNADVEREDTMIALENEIKEFVGKAHAYEDAQKEDIFVTDHSY